MKDYFKQINAMIKKLIITSLLVISAAGTFAQMLADKEAEMDKFITSLMSKMTLEEK